MTPEEIVKQAIADLQARQHEVFAKYMPALIAIADGDATAFAAKKHGIASSTLQRYANLLCLEQSPGKRSLDTLAKKVYIHRRGTRIEAIKRCAQTNDCESCRYVVRRLEKLGRNVELQ